MTAAGSERTCPKGHRYRKTSDCPTCPQCEQERKPTHGFLSVLSAPARRALEREGITAVEHFTAYREGDILALHGVGPSTIPKLRAALAERGLAFKQ